MARVLSQLIEAARKKVVGKSSKRIGSHAGGGGRGREDIGRGKRKIKPTKHFEFPQTHTLFSEATRKHENKVKNGIYQERFQAKKHSKSAPAGSKEIKYKNKQLEKTVRRQNEIIRKLKERNEMKIQKLSVKNKQLKARKTSPNKAEE